MSFKIDYLFKTKQCFTGLKFKEAQSRSGLLFPQINQRILNVI